jgi:radical SAM protein (TIGR01212 family)
MRINFFRKSGEARIQKIPLDIGGTCPNRDGKLSDQGCTFCSPGSFVPFYCKGEKSVRQQLEEGIAFFSRKYRCDGFLAYFQNNSTTYGNIERVYQAFAEVLEHPAINGIVVATRPDCIDKEILNRLAEIGKSHLVRLEIGIESLNPKVLERVNRCHGSEIVLEILKQIRGSGIEVCGHLIIGLPGETSESLVDTARSLKDIDILKLHHLQVVKGSQLAQDYLKEPFPLLEPEEYMRLLGMFIANLSGEIRIERLINRVPRSLLIAPVWNGITEAEFRQRLSDYMKKEGLSQGCMPSARFPAAC